MRYARRPFRRCNVIALRLILLSVVLFARPAFAQVLEMNSELVGPLRYVRFFLVQGRIEGFSPQSDRNTTLTANRNDRQERLSMVLVEGLPTVEYSLTAPDVQLRIELKEGREMLIDRQPKDPAQTAMRFEQSPQGPTTLTLTAAGTESRHQAPTLWHLWLAQPQACTEHLAPLLGVLRPDWEALPQAAQRVEQALLRAAGTRHVHDRARWTHLVAELAREEFSVRQAADRELRQAGQAVLPFLKNLDPARLDAEQRYRVRLIVEALAGNYEDDSPPNVAAWLVADPAAWLALLERPDVELRQAALEQLRQLLPGQHVEFDPEAEEPIRREQLEKLRQGRW